MNNVFGCYTIVKVGLWFPGGYYESYSHLVFLLGGISSLFSGRLPQAKYSHLVELKRQISEFGEIEMAGYQKAECQRIENLVEKGLQKSAWLLWKYLLDIELLKYAKVGLKAARAVRCKIPRAHTGLGGIQILMGRLDKWDM